MTDITTIPDVQGFVDNRLIPIKKVGIKDIKHPISLPNKDGSIQPTISMTNMYVNLPADQKGTHMSRFIQIIDKMETVNADILSDLLDEITETLDSENAYIEMDMPYFMKKSAPISKQVGLMDYQIKFFAQKENGVKEIWTQIEVPVTSLCPCSKKISKYGAHNQRSILIVRIMQNGHQHFEELIRSIEAQGSCELYAVLKRPDEKYITERAYDNPKFVEDIVRDVAIQMIENDNVLSYSVSSENFESIHNHSAYAVIEGDKRK